MKKPLLLLVALLMILSIIPIFAFGAEVDTKNEYNTTLGEIQNMLLLYFEDVQLTYKPGTQSYYEYISDQLLNHTDHNLIRHPNYALIHAYMAEYKVTYDEYLTNTSYLNNKSNIAPFTLTDKFLGQTIGNLKKRNVEKISGRTNKSNRGISYVYDGVAAAQYAIAHADERNFNPNYPDYRNSGGDCTNFVSQCITAGGIEMNGSNGSVGIHSSTTQWYCTYLTTSIFGTRKYSVSTSWIRVSDFNTYMSSFINEKSIVVTLSALNSACEVGDVVQLADKTTGTPYHSIIISSKDSATSYFCGHSNSRNNEDIMSYLDDLNDIFILFDFN